MAKAWGPGSGFGDRLAVFSSGSESNVRHPGCRLPALKPFPRPSQSNFFLSGCVRCLGYWLPHHNEGGGQRCLASMDSDLQAFSCNPTDGSFVVLAKQVSERSVPLVLTSITVAASTSSVG